jgi:hypothetical protein
MLALEPFFALSLSSMDNRQYIATLGVDLTSFNVLHLLSASFTELTIYKLFDLFSDSFPQVFNIW